MSSHHFVKEGQEPALLITGDAAYSSVEALLEWAPTILVAAEAAEKVLSWGIKVDAVLSAQAEIRDIRNRFLDEQVVDVIAVPETGHYIETAVDYLAGRHQHQLAIVADSFSGIRSVAESQLARISLVVLENDLRWIPVLREFRKWTSRSGIYHIVPAECSTFETDGLQSESGHFVAENDGLISVLAHGLIWIGESYKN